MADLEPYCDSEEEVFFGPVTEKEKLIYKALKMKEISKGNDKEDRYVGGDEGLHALAEAAAMLSISSRAECMDETYQSPGVAHHTSLASSKDNSSCSFNNPVNANSPLDSFLALEAQCKIEDSFEKNPHNLIPICELEQLPPLEFSTTELQDVNDKSDFEMKLSDNEEELEKVERNLKVEEIIKFLADEDTKIHPEEKKETVMVENEQDKSSQEFPPQNGNSKSNEEEDDVVIIDINDDEIVDLTDCQIKDEVNISGDVRVDFKCESSSMDLAPSHNDVKIETGPKEEPMESNISLSENDIKKEIQSSDEIVYNNHEKGFPRENESKCEVITIPSPSPEKRKKEISDEYVEIPRLDLKEEIKKEASHLPVMKHHGKVSSLNSKDAAVTQRRLKTPSKVLPKPVHGAISSNPHKPAMVGETKRHPVTSVPPMSSMPAWNAISSAKTPVKGTNCTAGINFKTPNSKANIMAASKIPQALHVTPSPRKNKYADVMSPVAQYIHGNSTVLIANKNTPLLKSTIHREAIKIKTNASDQADSVDRGSENIDVNNITKAPIPSNVSYKSAVPIKIFSPSPIKSKTNGPVVSVSKHIGRIKITSLKTGDIQVPLGKQCRDSLIPDGEVSVLVTKEF